MATAGINRPVLQRGGAATASASCPPDAPYTASAYAPADSHPPVQARGSAGWRSVCRNAPRGGRGSKCQWLTSYPRRFQASWPWFMRPGSGLSSALLVHSSTGSDSSSGTASGHRARPGDGGPSPPEPVP